MQDEPLFKLKNVARIHQGRTVLELPYLALNQSGVTVIQGPNGAGKSTLLGILAMLDKPDRGRVMFMGREPMAAPGGVEEARKAITLVHQNAYLFRSTVNKNLEYGLSVRKAPKARRRQLIQNALETVGLKGFGNRRAHTLSGGEARRAALARALVLEPKALLLDEPFANLDPESAFFFESTIMDTAQVGCSVILVTHQSQRAKTLANRLITLKGGKVSSDFTKAHEATNV